MRGEAKDSALTRPRRGPGSGAVAAQRREASGQDFAAVDPAGLTPARPELVADTWRRRVDMHRAFRSTRAQSAPAGAPLEESCVVLM